MFLEVPLDFTLLLQLFVKHCVLAVAIAIHSSVRRVIANDYRLTASPIIVIIIIMITIKKVVSITIRCTYYIFCRRNKSWPNPDLLDL